MTATGVQSSPPGAVPAPPWIWPARPPHDRGAAICAALVLTTGIAAVTLLGARDFGRRPASD